LNKKKTGEKLSEVDVMVSMPRSLKARLAEEAARRHLTLNGLIRMALARWLELTQT